MSKPTKKELKETTKNLDPSWNDGKKLKTKDSNYLQNKKVERSLNDIINRQSKHFKILLTVMALMVISDIIIFSILFVLN